MISLTKTHLVRRMADIKSALGKSALGVEVPLRRKNQITLPAEVARALDASPGDRLLVEVNPEAPHTAVLRRIRDSYFGALPRAYGDDHDQSLEYLRAERASWAE
jgi:AbrB family looped-hinge helix DNA binding protein